MSQISRKTEHIVQGQPTRDGAGVNLVRVLTQQWQRRLDPGRDRERFITNIKS